MWYNETDKTRGNVITFPDGVKISASDADESPIRGWTWHDEPPLWWIELNEPIEQE